MARTHSPIKSVARSPGYGLRGSAPALFRDDFNEPFGFADCQSLAAVAKGELPNLDFIPLLPSLLFLQTYGGHLRKV